MSDSGALQWSPPHQVLWGVITGENKKDTEWKTKSPQEDRAAPGANSLKKLWQSWSSHTASDHSPAT